MTNLTKMVFKYSADECKLRRNDEISGANKLNDSVKTIFH